jgi:O-antigen ligase
VSTLDARALALDAPAIAVYAAFFAAVLIATMRRPALGVAALVAVVPFAFYRELGPTTLTLSKIGLLGTLAGLLAGRRSFAVLRERTAAAFLACALLVTAATALSLWHALYRAPALRETFKSVEYLLVFVAVYAAWRADPDERMLRVALAVTLVAVSALALAQEFTGAPSGIWVMNYPVPRIAGPLEGPNQLAGYLGLGLSLVTAFACTRRPLPVEFAALALGTAALVLTMSRAGIAASAAGIVLVVLLSPARAKRLVLGALGGGAVAGTAGLAVWGYAATHSTAGLWLIERLASAAEAGDPGSVGTRSQLWRAAWTLWLRHPFFGIGAGNFEFELPLAGYPTLRTHANSLYLQALAEGGVPLFSATLALVATSLVRFARGPFDDPLVLGALGASAGFALHQIVDLLVFYPKVGELWWIVLALGAARFDALAARSAPHRLAA